MGTTNWGECLLCFDYALFVQTMGAYLKEHAPCECSPQINHEATPCRCGSSSHKPWQDFELTQKGLCQGYFQPEEDLW